LFNTWQMLAEEFRKTPFVKIAVPFISGIVIQLLFSISWYVCFTGCFISLAILIFFNFSKWIKTFAYQYLWGIAVTFFLLCSGIMITAWKDTSAIIPRDFFTSTFQLVEINDIPIYNNKSINTTVDILAYETQGKWHKGNWPCKVNFRQTTHYPVFNPGTRLMVKGEVKKIDLPVAPYEFSYNKYLKYKGIQCQLILFQNKSIPLKERNKSLIYRLLNFRQFLLDKLNNKLIDKREQAVLSSLVLGFTGNLDPEIRTSFAATGTVHILSVSGMHVGIVYFLLLSLLFFLNKSQKLRILRSILIIAGIWFYALITGFAPPIIRSAVMFSFFAAGEALNRGSNGFNTLAASAFFILLFNPYQIMDIGFQLSYAAIIGILLFYEPIYQKYHSKYWFLDKIWALVAVSFAAQLCTLPLTLWYFHQFPIYFIPANLIVVPLSTLILYGGLLLLGVSFVHPIATCVAFIMKYLLLFLNETIIKIEHLPASLIKNIYVSSFEAIVLFLVIITVAIWIYNKNSRAILFLLICSLTFVASKVIHQISLHSQQNLIIYNTPGHSSLALTSKGSILLLTDSICLKKIEKASTNMYLRMNINQSKSMIIPSTAKADTHVNEIHIHLFAGKNILIQFQNKRIVWLNDKNILKYTCARKPYVDYVIVTRNSRCKPDQILKYFNAALLIYDASFKSNETENNSHKENLTIPLIFINETGAYKTDL
jgi:competence protein ComEC